MGSKWITFEIKGPKYLVADFTEILDLINLTYCYYYENSNLTSYDALEIQHIQTNSYTINLKGLGEGIEAIGKLLRNVPELFTPTYWRKKQEELKMLMAERGLKEEKLEQEK